MAKYRTTDLVKRITGKCINLIGDMGNQENSPIVQTWRDVQVWSIFAGTNEIMKGIIVKSMKL